jgi:hypothetical protein
VTKWTQGGAWRVAIIGLIAILGGMVVAGALFYRDHDRPVTEYAIDAPSAPFGGGGACYGCRTLDFFDLTGPAAGVRAMLPTDPVFRGLVLTSDALPDGLRNVRVVPDGYYLEFTDGTVRFVVDRAPWAAMESQLEPEWISYLVREGVIDSA